MEATAGWATATSSASCCPRRSRPWLASASSLCRPHHSIAITADGAVWSWGFGVSGRLGQGEDMSNQLLPKKVDALAGQRIVAVSSGDRHSIALTADGAVFAWGEEDHSCLGHGEDLSNQLLPKKIEAWPPGAGAVV